MLKELHIRHYSLIESLNVEFRSGFSVITGETGAGKSIMVGALMLLLGGRADSNVLSQGAGKCTVEALFESGDKETEQFLLRNDLDYDDGQILIRRELTNTGKSRAFINDTPVNLSVVRELSEKLVDIHSQHQNLLLNNSGFQMEVVDSVAQDEGLLSSYRESYRKWHDQEQALLALKEDTDRNRERADFLRFQHNEIATLKLREGEQEELEEEQLVLGNAENIKQALYEANSAISPVGDKLTQAQRALAHISEVFPQAAELASRLESASIEIDDIQSELQSHLSDIRFDNNRLDEVSSRLDTIYALLKKYHKSSVAELLELQSSLEQSLKNVDNAASTIGEKEALCLKLKNEAAQIAAKLSEARQKAAKKVEREMEERLRPLGMPNIRFVASITPSPKLTPTGRDEVAFLFSANKNGSPQSLQKIASGGEIARVMLSLKAMLSKRLNLPTIIFDEIDTGVSGKIADEMANVMEEISQGGRQVISITHSPQIAARGQIHYRVYKQDTDTATHTYIQTLTPQQRIDEVAKMLSGAAVTNEAKANAKTLLKL